MPSLKINIGLDVGSTSVKLAAWVPGSRADRFGCGPYWIPEGLALDGDRVLVLSRYVRHVGEPAATAARLVDAFLRAAGSGPKVSLRATGSGGREAAGAIACEAVNEYRAIAEGVSMLIPDVRTVVDIGGVHSKYIRLDTNGNGSLQVVDYETNGECAAGTGLFFDQQVERLQVKVEDVGALARNASRTAIIAGRCSVFAKSDMIHAQQRGFSPPDILKGLCEAVARNIKGSLVKGRNLVPRIALIGGVSMNAGIVDAFRALFDLRDGNLIVPDLGPWFGAIGCLGLGVREPESGSRKVRGFGFRLSDSGQTDAGFFALPRSRPGPSESVPVPNPRPGTLHPPGPSGLNQDSGPASHDSPDDYPHTQPLSMEKVVLLRDRVEEFRFPVAGRVPAFLGIDIGSVSTNLALVTESGDLIHGIYTMTRGRPVEMVTECLADLESAAGGRVDVLGIGTTGSGRDLIGLLVGADVVKDEITAHKTGAVHVAERFLGRDVDTIFEIGGQDSKFISLRRGTVMDFCLNEACAAGTGSFLEEQARQIGVDIRGEFASLALRSSRPLKLGERCTVFMATELAPYLQRGVPKEALVAGLAFSVAQNYLNRVVKKRPVGDTVFLQGGTAYNDAVAAAFATLLGREIIVPPHNGIMGAIGAALLAMRRPRSDSPSAFRGWRIGAVPRSRREFFCNACTNRCAVEEFTVAGEKSYWGDKCSDRYRKQTKTDRRPVLSSLLQFREERMLPFRAPGPESVGTRGHAGIPLTLYFQDRLPFWKTYLESLGFSCVFSGPTDSGVTAAGVEACVNEPCFPVQAAHGHLVRLKQERTDFLFFPNVVNEEDPVQSVASFLCPWVQTLPLVARHAAALETVKDRIACPTVAFREGPAGVEAQLRRAMAPWNVSAEENRTAVRNAYAAQERFRQDVRDKGAEALRLVGERKEPAVALIGRPYNLYDPGMNLNVPRKLADLYGANVIPMDFLPIDAVDIRSVNDHMFWNYGRRILQAARFTRDLPDFHLIYLSNFKCGPDSYIRHYVEEAAGRPFLFLQFDSHSNDAGIMTRIEAFLESRRLL